MIPLCGSVQKALCFEDEKKLNTYFASLLSHLLSIILFSGSFQLNSQIAPSFSQIRVLATLTMLSFALEAKEGCNGHINPWFLQ